MIVNTWTGVIKRRGFFFTGRIFFLFCVMISPALDCRLSSIGL